VNIGFVVHNYDPHEGTGGYAVELLGRIAAHHDVTLYANRLAVDPPAGVRTVHVPAARGTAYSMILSFPLGFRAVRRRHDLVHSQGWSASAADVYTAHIVLAAWRQATRLAGTRSPAGERLFGGLVERREHAAFRRARAVIAPSRRAQRDLAAHYGCADTVRVVPHGCDRVLDRQERSAVRSRLGLPQTRFLALYLGDARKGLEVAVRALADAPDADLLVLTYSDPAAMRGLAASLDLADRLHWLPPAATAADAFAAADVLLHPTIYDTFAMPVGEALWAGLPVIVSAEAGAAELVEHEVSAWVLQAPTVTHAADALRTLARDAALRERLARAGRAVARRFTWDETARRTLAVYEAVAR